MNQNSHLTSSSSTQETQSGKKQAILDEAKETVGHVADQARDQVGMRISSQKEKAADTIGSIADAIRQTGDKMRDTGPLPEFADRAADGVERVANYLQTRSVGDIVREVERFARREPAVFFGAAFALGLLGGRFLKSSSRRGSQAGDTWQTWDAGRERDPRDYGGYARSQQEYLPAYREERETSRGYASSPYSSTYGQPDTLSTQRAPSAPTSATADKSSPSSASYAGSSSKGGAGSAGYGATGQPGTSTLPTGTNPGGSTAASAGSGNLGSASPLPSVGAEHNGSRNGGSGRV